MRKRIKTYMILSVVVMALCASNANAQLVTGNYSILLDSNGDILSSSGNGYQGIWYPYSSGRIIMWFQSSGLDLDRQGEIIVAATVKPLDHTQPYEFEFEYGHSREDWPSATTPPLPTPWGPVASSSDERFAFSSRLAKSFSSGTSPVSDGDFQIANRTLLVEFFHPEWIYVSIRGKNIDISNQEITVESMERGPVVIGACCNQSNEDCYLTDEGTCRVPNYKYLGANSTCANCQIQNFIWDFGDAPASYQVTKASNGAQHTVVSNMHLGANVNADVDGQPNVNAAADLWDDGVQFNSSVRLGQSTSVTVTASSLGVINAWLDLNSDGDWADAGEHILMDEPVVQGQNILSFYVPVYATAGQSFARFRYNSFGGLSYAGVASDGEVEDYSVVILSDSNPDPDPDPGPNPNPGITPASPASQFASKWNQPVDLLAGASQFVYGWNLATRRDALPLIADDWNNNGVLPVQGFRWWGAFDNWMLAEMPVDLPLGFQVGIWTHNPGIDKPGSLIWEQTITNWAWAYTGQVQDAQGQIGGEAVFEFTSLLSQDEWFYPSAAPNTVYWLSITPIYATGVISNTPWGWMTRQTNGTLAAERILSVHTPTQWPPVLGATYAAGSPVTYPGAVEWDVAFEIITSQPGGGSASGSSGDLEDAIGDLNNDGIIDINDLYILLGFVLNP